MDRYFIIIKVQLYHEQSIHSQRQSPLCKALVSDSSLSNLPFLQDIYSSHIVCLHKKKTE